jgi:hypothetical protein
MPSAEIPGNIASSSEKKRWLENGAVIINGKKPRPDDIIDLMIEELILLPNSPRRCTMI